MPWSRILLVVILAIMAVMILTAIIHLIAPYVAALAVIVFFGWIFNRGKKEGPPE